MTISGIGAMYDYDPDSNPSPWADPASSVVTVSVGNGVTTVGSYSFCDCENLSSIGTSAFYDCIGLTKVYLSNSILAAKELAHTSNGSLCSRAKMIAVSRGETTLGSYITSNYTKSTTIYYNGKLYDLYTDHTCRWIEGTINNVCSVCSACCYHNLNYVPTEFVAPTCTEKGYTLYSCLCGYTEKRDYVAAAKHTCVNGICTVCGYARDWEYAVMGSTVTIKGYTGSDTVLTIPQKIDGYRVTVIDSEAFYKNKSLKEVIIPEGVKEIDRWAFYDCTNLKKVTIPTTLEKVADRAFCNTGLEDVYISDLKAWLNIDFEIYLIDIGWEECSSSPMIAAENLYLNGVPVTEVVVPEDVTYIPAVAFGGWNNLTSVTLHENVTGIDGYAFYGTAITEIVIPEKVQSIGWNAFRQCKQLKDVYISDIASWCAIKFGGPDYWYLWGASGTNPLYHGQNLYVDGKLTTQLAIPEGVTSIPTGAFWGWENVTKVVIPTSVTQIGEYAFKECTSLKDVYYDGTNSQWKKVTVNSGALPYSQPQYHIHNAYYYSTELTEPTCTEPGYINYICSCGSRFPQVNTPAAGHSYADGSCTVCGEKESEGTQPPAGTQISIQKGDDGNFYYYVDGVFDGSYTGLAEHNGYRWYVRHGQVILDANGLISVDSGSYYVKGGRVESYSGLKKLEGQWLYFLDGKNDTDFVGLALHNGMLAYVENGAVNFNKTDMVMYQGKGYYVKYGIWFKSFTGLIKSSDKVWRYIEKGLFNNTYEGAAKNSVGWWCVRKGVIDPNFTGLVNHNGSAYYAKYGQIMFSTTGILEIDGSSYYIKGGMFQSSYTGLITVDTGCWYLRNGKVDYTYNGKVDVNGVMYTVVNGFATVK